MANRGLFKGLEQEVAASVDSVGLILKKYPSSEAGKSLMALFSGRYYHFLKDLWTGLEQMEKPPSLLLKQHLASRLQLDLNMLALALYRAFRRVLYCKCFNGIDLAQMKQAGLYAYWIAKMRPIVVGTVPEGLERLDNKLEEELQEINERFAVYIIRAFYKDEFHRDISNANDYQVHFVHAVRFRSFTEDSMMLATESLGVSGSNRDTVF
jgi:hypothetical protein